MRLALVVAVHPERRTVDLVYQDNAMRIAECHILSSLVASDAGAWDIPDVPKPTTERSAGQLPTNGRQLVAAVDEVAGRPVVVGFLHPLGGQVAFTQQDRHVVRHSSGAYTTVAPDGSIETYHPSGTYFRIGTGAHESLTPLSLENVWKEVSTAPPPTITLHHPKLDMTIAPDGSIALHGKGSAAVTIDKPATLDVPQGLTVNGNISVTGGVTVTQDVVAGVVSLRHHVQLNGGGMGNSGPPAGG